MKGEEPSGQVNREAKKGSALSPRKKLNVHTEQEASVEAQQRQIQRQRGHDEEKQHRSRRKMPGVTYKQKALLTNIGGIFLPK